MMEWILSSSVLIAVMAVLRPVLRGKISPVLQYALWGMVLLRLLVPWSPVQSEISVQNVFREPEVQAAVEAVQEPIRYESRGVKVDAESGEQIPVTSTYFIANREDPGDFYSPADIALNIWKAGCILIFGFMLTSNLVFLRKLSRDRERVVAAGCPLPVYVTSQVDTPCLACLLRPVIYLTPESREPERLRHVLAHELTHYRHGDHIIGVLRCAALALHWYNPLVWWAAMASRQDGELACDAGTIARLGEDARIEYGRTLLEMTCVSKNGNVMLTATAMNTGKRSLKERIGLIAKKPKMAAYTLIAVIAVMALVVGCTFTGAKQGSQLAQLSNEELVRLLQEETDPERLGEILTAFAKKTGLYQGESWIREYDSDRRGGGFALDAGEVEQAGKIFSQYTWERVSGQQDFPEESGYLELELEYTHGESVRILMQVASKQTNLLQVCWYIYDENAASQQGQQSCVFWAAPKEETGPVIYGAFYELFQEKKEAARDIPEETSVQAEQEPDFQEVAHEILDEAVGADLILSRTVSPTLAFDMGQEQLQVLAVLFENYTWELAPDWYPPEEGGHPIFLFAAGGGAMIFYDMESYVYTTVYEDAPEDAVESFMWKVTAMEDGTKPIYEAIAQIYQDAIADDYYERSSERIAGSLSDALLSMARSGEISSDDPSGGKYELGESNAQACADLIHSYLWVEALNDFYRSVYPQDQHRILLEGDGWTIQLYADQDLLKYTSGEEVYYYFYIPIWPGQSRLADEMIALFEQLRTAP